MRGQAHTLEATVAALLMLSSLIFALQMTAVTPLSASTSSQHIENQQEATGQGVLATAAHMDALKPAILYWNNTSEQYHNASNGDYFTAAPPPIRFGEILSRSFNDRGIAYNVYFWFQNPDGTPTRDEFIYSGVPSDNAVAATHTVVLTDDDRLVDERGGATGLRIANASANHTIPDTGNNVYNTVQVEVVAWRI